MLEILRSYSTFYAAARLFGVLPYTWIFEDITCPMKGQRAKSEIFVRSKSWKAWSIVYLLYVTVICALDAIDALRKSRIVVKFDTLDVFHKMYDVMSSILIVGVQVIYLVKHNEAASLVQGYLQYVVCHPPPLAKRTKILNQIRGIMFFLIAPMNIAFYMTGLVLSGPFDISFFLFTSKTAIKMTLIYYLTITHYSNIEFALTSLKQLLKPFDDVFENEEGQMSNFNQWVENFKCRKARKISNHGSLQTNYEPKMSDAEILKYLDGVDFEKTEEEVVNVFSLCKKCDNYIDKPMSFIMFILMLWILISTFHLTLLPYFPFAFKVVTCINFLTAVIPTFDLLNNTHVFNERVSNYYCLKESLWV